MMFLVGTLLLIVNDLTDFLSLNQNISALIGTKIALGLVAAAVVFYLVFRMRMDRYRTSQTISSE